MGEQRHQPHAGGFGGGQKCAEIRMPGDILVCRGEMGVHVMRTMKDGDIMGSKILLDLGS
jgi:hypothetical protein